MERVTTIGLDIAKSVFQVHGVDAAGEVVVRRRLTRRKVLAFFAKLPPCLVGMEACATAHHWARELRRWATGAADAAELCEALREAAEERCGRCRGDLRGGDPAQHALCRDQDLRAAERLVLHRVRQLLMRQRRP